MCDGLEMTVLPMKLGAQRPYGKRSHFNMASENHANSALCPLVNKPQLVKIRHRAHGYPRARARRTLVFFPPSSWQRGCKCSFVGSACQAVAEPKNFSFSARPRKPQMGPRLHIHKLNPSDPNDGTTGHGHRLVSATILRITPSPGSLGSQAPCRKGMSGMDAGLKFTRMHSRRPLRQGTRLPFHPKG